VPPNTFTRVPFGTHRLTATLDDYEPITRDIQVRKGMASEIRLQLKPRQRKRGRRLVRSPKTSPKTKDVRMRYLLEGAGLIDGYAYEFSTPLQAGTVAEGQGLEPEYVGQRQELPTFFPPRATDRFLIPLVTHIEHIQPDGKPVLDQRWGFDLPRYGPLTLGSLLRALLNADPGRYRLVALVASRQPLIAKDAPMTPDQVVILNEGPSWLGDSPWKTVVATTDFHLIAYVYEFERKSRSEEPVLQASSNLTAQQHLQSTGLYDAIETECSE
jgi:hypothetical protein